MDPSRILLPNGQIHSTNLFMKDVPIQFPRLETYINFQVWLGSVYDVILGMQWLDPMDALVACKGGLVYYTKPNGFAFELTNMQTLPITPLLFAKQFKKWVQNDKKLFTISVHEPINEPVNEDGLNEMAKKLLEKYSNVFPAKLHSLPPIQEVDHAIDLMSNVKLISKAPYRFSFTKYEELEQQLNDLLNKG